MNSEPRIDTIFSWHARAQLDYNESYMRLYICYNSWYQQVTGVQNDRLAINRLKKRYIIWADYTNGKALQQLRPIVAQIVTATQHPTIFKVTLSNDTDWPSLIEYWYQIRCHLFHGSIPVSEPDYQQHIQLAYHSLNLFMAEIISRMNNTFSDNDMQELLQITQLIHFDAPKKQ